MKQTIINPVSWVCKRLISSSGALRCLTLAYHISRGYLAVKKKKKNEMKQRKIT